VRIDVLTIFPGWFDGPLTTSLLGKAREAGTLDVRVHDLRAWTTDRHRTVDDAPYGGGAGMVMRADVWFAPPRGSGTTCPPTPRPAGPDRRRARYVGRRRPAPHGAADPPRDDR
jgi:tRNA (guanine37-N1)-methyltransferase